MVPPIAMDSWYDRWTLAPVYCVNYDLLNGALRNPDTLHMWCYMLTCSMWNVEMLELLVSSMDYWCSCWRWCVRIAQLLILMYEDAWWYIPTHCELHWLINKRVDASICVWYITIHCDIFTHMFLMYQYKCCVAIFGTVLMDEDSHWCIDMFSIF